VRFILVDQILKWNPEEHRCFETIQHGGFLRDHFPDFPCIPGVLLTGDDGPGGGSARREKSAAGAMLAHQLGDFRSWVEPANWPIRADIKSNGLYAAAKCSIEVNSKTVCDADLFFPFVPTAKFAQIMLMKCWRGVPESQIILGQA
jgi:3-hydroxymyristoyl/3-hydroxydecanoyl-(acyl carrier protein) dehydratase